MHPLNPETHTCPDCGFVWKHGEHGGHSCAVLLKARVAELEAKEIRLIASIQADDTVIRRYREALERFAAYDPDCDCGMCVPCHSRIALEANIE